MSSWIIDKGRKKKYIYIYKIGEQHERRTLHRVTFSRWEIRARFQLIATQFLHTGPLYSFGPRENQLKDRVQFSGNRRDLSRRSHCYQSLAWPILGFLIFCINNAPRLTIQETWTVANWAASSLASEFLLKIKREENRTWSSSQNYWSCEISFQGSWYFVLSFNEILFLFFLSFFFKLKYNVTRPRVIINWKS